MEGFLGSGLLWVKALHIIFVIFWISGLFALPRYFAYHSEVTAGSEEDKIWIQREKRLLRIILNPSLILVWIFGLLLAANIGAGAGGWLHAKLFIVLLLTFYHMKLAGIRKEFVRGENKRSTKFYRIFNEVPAIATLLIVIFAVVRPF